MTLKIVWEYNGEKGEYIEEHPNFPERPEETLRAALFMWEEGNYSCDCNRSRSFGLADKYPHKCSSESIEEGHPTFPCNDGIKGTIRVLSISWELNGKKEKYILAA